MKQLRFTTTKAMGMFELIATSEQVKPLCTPDNKGELILSKTKTSSAYIHGKAEQLAGFDIPFLIDGDTAQLDLPIDQQDILMILPSGTYKCKAYLDTVVNNLPKGAYLIILEEESIDELKEEISSFYKDFADAYKNS